MQETILKKSSELFLTYGFKSVTMDDIAESLGISKKTIYDYYQNKNELVRAGVKHFVECMEEEIALFLEKNTHQNPISILFESITYFKRYMKEDSTAYFQLKKYYPKIFENLHQKKLKITTFYIKQNIKEGIEQRLYLSNIDLEFASKLYYINIVGVKESGLFSEDIYKFSEVVHQFTYYFMRSLATEKGLKQLNQYLLTHEL